MNLLNTNRFPIDVGSIRMGPPIISFANSILKLESVHLYIHQQAFLVKVLKKSGYPFYKVLFKFEYPYGEVS